MPKIIALQAPTGPLAARLRRQGYQVVDLLEAQRQRLPVDAILYTNYQPEIVTPYNSGADVADIVLGPPIAGGRQPLYLNITGQTAEQIISVLRQRLRPHV